MYTELAPSHSFLPIQPSLNPATPKKAGLVHLRAKLKHVLWLGDLKASLKNAAEKSFHKTSSNAHSGQLDFKIA